MLFHEGVTVRLDHVDVGLEARCHRRGCKLTPSHTRHLDDALQGRLQAKDLLL